MRMCDVPTCKMWTQMRVKIRILPTSVQLLSRNSGWAIPILLPLPPLLPIPSLPFSLSLPSLPSPYRPPSPALPWLLSSPPLRSRPLKSNQGVWGARSVLLSVPEGRKIVLGTYNYPSPQGRTFSTLITIINIHCSEISNVLFDRFLSLH